MNEAEATELLAPYGSVLSTCFRSGILDWHRLLSSEPGLTGGLGGRTRASFIHERIVYRLQVEQPNCPGLYMKKIRGLWVVDIRDQLILKLKKLDKKLRSRNVPTLQTTLFDNQGVLPGTAVESTKATAGYTLDALSALPARLVVVCWDGTDRRWMVDLEDVNETAQVYEIDAEQTAPERERTKTKTGSGEQRRRITDDDQ